MINNMTKIKRAHMLNMTYSFKKKKENIHAELENELETLGQTTFFSPNGHQTHFPKWSAGLFFVQKRKRVGILNMIFICIWPNTSVFSSSSPEWLPAIKRNKQFLNLYGYNSWNIVDLRVKNCLYCSTKMSNTLIYL